MVATALGLAVAAGVLLGALFLQQDRLLYYPVRSTLERMAPAGGPLRPWPSAQDFRGLVAETAASAPARGTVVVFHGNAGHAGDRGFYAEALLRLGWRVLLAEHPGYGARGGALGETSLVDDATATLALAHAQYGAPLVVLGESLGAAVAAGAASAQPAQVAALVLVTPWDRLVHVAAHHYPWLPVRWMLRDEYDSTARLAAFDKPVVVVAAEHDAVVPLRFGRALFDTLAAPKRWIVVPGAGHNDWMERVDAAWWRDLLGPVAAAGGQGG